MHFNTKSNRFARFDVATITFILANFLVLAFANC
jgi:hypothetical protein